MTIMLHINGDCLTADGNKLLFLLWYAPVKNRSKGSVGYCNNVSRVQDQAVSMGAGEVCLCYTFCTLA